MSEINYSSSTGEAIMICIDTSRWMKSTESPMFEDQANAIELYCNEKLKNPETLVDICGMGDKCITHLCKPTRELSHIIGSLYAAIIGGYLMLLEAVTDAHDVWFGHSGKKLGRHLSKRIAVFAGGSVYHDNKADVQTLGEKLKERNIACDAISFGDPAENKQELFDILIAVADKNGNCNVLHVPPESSVRDALSRFQIIRSGSTPIASLSVQQESYSVADNTDALALSRPLIIPHVGGSGPLASLLVQQESSKLNAKAAASYPESVNPHDLPAKVNASSQSVVDLKLENVKPNMQPETLDQRIERARQKLESLIMQKNNQVAC